MGISRGRTARKNRKLKLSPFAKWDYKDGILNETRCSQTLAMTPESNAMLSRSLLHKPTASTVAPDGSVLMASMTTYSLKRNHLITNSLYNELNMRY